MDEASSRALDGGEIVKADRQLIRLMSDALAEACPEGRLTVTDVDYYAGVSSHSRRSSLVWQLRAGPLDLTETELHQRLAANYPLLGRFLPAGAGEAPLVAENLAGLAAELSSRLLASIQGIDLEWGIAPADAEQGQEYEVIGGGAATRAAFWLEQLQPIPTVQATVAIMFALAETIGASAPSGQATKWLTQLQKLSVTHRLNHQSQLLVSHARKRDIAYLPLAGNPGLWQFGWGSRSETFWEAASNGDGLVGNFIAKDKGATKRFLRQLGLPAPTGHVIGAKQDFRSAAQSIGFPCVVKPLDQGRGRGVTANIRNEAELERAVALARSFSSRIVIETHVEGFDHRLMVVEGQLVGAVRRQPPSVIGDGASTVRQLIERLNAKREGPLRDIGYLNKVDDDAALAATLLKSRVGMDSVLEKGREIPLRTNANRSTGGVSVNVLGTVNPQVKGFAELLAKAARLRTVGIDYITTDISRSPDEVGGGFIEINTTPGMTVILAGGADPDELARLIIGERDRIPVTLVVGTAEAQAVLAAGIDKWLDAGAAAAGRDWVRVAGVALPSKGLDPVAVTQAALHHASVDTLLILWSEEDVYRYGFPVDLFARAILVGGPLRPQWQEALAGICGDVAQVETAQAALDLLREA